MALAIRSSTPFTYEADFVSTTLDVTKPAGTTTGDLLIFWVGADGTSGNIPTLPAGWTAVEPFEAGGQVSAGAYYRVADGSEPSVYELTYATGDGTVYGGGIICLSDADSVDVSSITSTGSVTTHTAPDVTTTVDDCIVLRLLALDNDSYIDDGSPTGTTNLWSNNSALGGDLGSVAAYETQVTAGATGTADFTGSPGQQGVISTIAIAPTVGGSTTTQTGAVDLNFSVTSHYEHG